LCVIVFKYLVFVYFAGQMSKFARSRLYASMGEDWLGG
jgi:hypothetical protein